MASKCHFNSFLNSVPFVSTNDVRKVFLSIIQIMGFDLHIYIMKLVNRKLYIIEDVFFISFPTVAKNIRSGIEKIINGLSLVEVSSK